jgi:hypothetical protein
VRVRICGIRVDNQRNRPRGLGKYIYIYIFSRPGYASINHLVGRDVLVRNMQLPRKHSSQ